ncbi:MAG TPA: PIN domain-containing protein [Pirellulales bacterium]|jgi:predicted nucleic acid-binding protein|nr:PIN domain-containing protein [Pirellulales bacterium]
MRVLLDTNIILDIVLRRVPWEKEAVAIFQASQDGRLHSAATSLSIATVFYVIRRKIGAAKARAVVRDCLDVFEILGVDRDTIESADALAGMDFEDDIQCAAALQGEVEAIVTRDPKGFSASSLPVLSPAQLLAALPPTPPATA